MDEKKNPEVDIVGMMDQLMDGIITSDLRKSAKESGDPFTIGVVELCIKYGISGRNLVNFAQELNILMRMQDALHGKKEGEP